MGTMIDSKARYLENGGQHDNARWIRSVRRFVLSGLPRDGWAHLAQQDERTQAQRSVVGGESSARSRTLGSERCQPESKDALEGLRAWLQWQPDEDTSAKSTGRSLLLHAALGDECEAVRLLLPHESKATINAFVRNSASAAGEAPVTPLMAAMTFGTFATVRQLLDAKADPEKRLPGAGLDAFMLGADFGRAANIEQWIEYFAGTWRLERRDSLLGNSALEHCLGMSGDGTEATVRVLLAARANPCEVNAIGEHALYALAGNQNFTPTGVHLLVASGADVNLQLMPRSSKCRLFLRLARYMARRAQNSSC